MKILFNLASLRNSLMVVSENDVGLAHAMVARVCHDNGFPVAQATYNPDISYSHNFVFDNVRDYVESCLLGVHVTDTATLSSLGNLQFQLTTH